MTTILAFAEASIAATAAAPACPCCGETIPLLRPALAARLRCPEPSCQARLRMRAGRLLPA
jgi:hypothetical protein